MKKLIIPVLLSILISTNVYAAPVLMETTAYCEGSIGSHGDRMHEGYCAGKPDLYGSSVAIYKAEETDDGYKLGEFIGYFELKDTGYGYSTGKGVSKLRPDKKYAGTIESGMHLDIYRTNLSRCWDWMHLTQGKVFAVIIPDVKG